MDIFYIVVITIATILLILILTYIGILMKQTKAANTVFPPVQATCPDYWSYNSDSSSCVIPMRNEKNIGSIYGNVSASGPLTLDNTNTYGLDITKKTIDFTNKTWTTGAKSTICGQQSWANKYGIIWDGVSNYNGC